MRNWIFFIVVCCGLALAFNSCTKINYTSDPSDVLEFSHDTILFDSVFTTIGSITFPLIVYNPNSNAVLLDELELEGGVESQYRINVNGIGENEDGSPLTFIEDLTILAGDSIFVFVEVTVDPTNNTSSFIVEDSIRFLTNTVEQKVSLAAYAIIKKAIGSIITTMWKIYWSQTKFGLTIYLMSYTVN